MSSINLSSAFKGIRFKLTLVYSLSFGLFICVFAFTLTGHFFHLAQDNFDHALLNYAIDLSNELSADTKTKPILAKSDLKKQFPFSGEGTYYVIRSTAGSVLAKQDQDSKQDIPFDPDMEGLESYAHRFHTFQDGKTDYRAINLKLASGVLQVATPSTILDEQERRITWLTLILIPVLVILSAIVSFIISAKALAPIKVVTETVNNLAAKNLSLRLPEFQTKDEFQDLSITFNNLLARLQKAFEAQEHFVANASHQLNTPLAIIKGELDVLESKARTIEEHHKFNRSLREEVERMIELVKNLLLIARIEAGQEDSFRMRPLRLDDLAIGTMTRMKIKARDKRITIRFNMSEDIETDDLIIAGERQLLSSMFENLLDNSIKYSPEDSQVVVSISKQETVQISIKDEGPGIRPSELKNILEKRFRRGEMTLMPGTGIGLSIVYKIAEHHKAHISYEKLQPQGSLFTVHFARQIL